MPSSWNGGAVPRTAARTANRFPNGALAATSTTPQALLPDVPTIAQFLPGYEAAAWFGIGPPKATPADIVEKLDRPANAGLAIGCRSVVTRLRSDSCYVIIDSVLWGARSDRADVG
jgi:hypothetical protein